MIVGNCGLPATARPGTSGRHRSVPPAPAGRQPGRRQEAAGTAGAPGGPAPGLVTCAKTVRDLEPGGAVPDDLAGLLGGLWRPAFPAADLVRLAAGQFQPLPEWRGEEGPRWRISVSPGALAVGTRDRARAERAAERALAARRVTVQSLAAVLVDKGEFPADPEPTREITEWSRRSRARMTRRLCELDYRPLTDAGAPPALVTLTYPGDWLAVATDGRAVKRHLLAFKKRYRRAWGVPLAAVWKLEFQRRGAPHFHLLMVPPMTTTAAGQGFREWLSATWAAIVACPDPEERRRHQLAGTGIDYSEGLRASDPRRVAVYFTKHGTFAAKEYQHIVPDEWRAPGCGPGRFWGYWGLSRCVAEVEVTPGDAIAAARVIRRWARAQGTTQEARPPRYRDGQAVSAYPDVIGLAGVQFLSAHRRRRRRVRRRVRRLRSGRGWVSFNDAPGFAVELARYLADRGS